LGDLDGLAVDEAFGALSDDRFTGAEAGEHFDLVADAAAGFDQAEEGFLVLDHEGEFELAAGDDGVGGDAEGGEVAYEDGGAAELAGTEARVGRQVGAADIQQDYIVPFCL